MIDRQVFNSSIKKYRFPLCEDCQIWFIGKVFNATHETLQLYFCLKQRQIQVRLEQGFGGRRMEIWVEESGPRIIVDPAHQHGNPNRLLWEGSGILRIPEIMIRFHAEETSALIQKHLNSFSPS
jgi:hypothetical protein